MKDEKKATYNIHIGQVYLPKHKVAREKGYYMVVVDYHPSFEVGIGVIHMEDEPSSISYTGRISKDHYDLYDPCFDESPRIEKEKVLF
jgi:hypothetical protein